MDLGEDLGTVALVDHVDDKGDGGREEDARKVREDVHLLMERHRKRKTKESTRKMKEKEVVG